FQSGVVRSTNGIDWPTVATLQDAVLTVTYGNGSFVAVGGYESGWTGVSTDGVHWAETRYPTVPFRGVTFGKGFFVTVGFRYELNPPGIIATSTDGGVWQQQSYRTPQPLLAIAHGQERFVAVGSGGTVISSDDGVNWQLQNSGTTSDLSSIAYGN